MFFVNAITHFHKTAMSRNRITKGIIEGIVEEMITLFKQRVVEEKTAGRGDWISCIAFAGLYKGRSTKKIPARSKLILAWNTPAEEAIAYEMYAYLCTRGVKCHLRPGTYD